MMFLKNKKKEFDTICRINGLNLDYPSNRSGLALMRSIFIEREYALFFPFYEDAVIVDAGAHHGYFTSFAARNSGSKSRIISIEPSSFNFKMLEKNIAQCGFTQQVKAVHAALADHAGEMNLHHGSSINHSLFADYALNKGTSGSETVRTITLGEIFLDEKLDQIDFLKLDCEGAEYPVLLNTSDDVWQKVTTISMEFHDMKRGDWTGNALVVRLQNLGYRIAAFRYDPSNMGLNYGKIVATRLIK